MVQTTPEPYVADEQETAGKSVRCPMLLPCVLDTAPSRETRMLEEEELARLASVATAAEDDAAAELEFTDDGDVVTVAAAVDRAVEDPVAATYVLGGALAAFAELAVTRPVAPDAFVDAATLDAAASVAVPGVVAAGMPATALTTVALAGTALLAAVLVAPRAPRVIVYVWPYVQSVFARLKLGC